jgi:hypothetical protein
LIPDAIDSVDVYEDGSGFDWETGDAFKSAPPSPRQEGIMDLHKNRHEGLSVKKVKLTSAREE